MLREEDLLAIITEQHETIQRLENRISELEEQLHKDSHNSSKPPSSDGYEKPSPKSQRKKSGKKAGGQTGHKGHHMALEHPDRIERVYPVHCKHCPHRENCTHLRINHTCYAVDVIVQEWTEQIKAQQESGMTVTAYCAQNGINIKTYYYHLRKVREQCLESEPAIVPVAVPGDQHRRVFFLNPF